MPNVISGGVVSTSVGVGIVVCQSESSVVVSKTSDVVTNMIGEGNDFGGVGRSPAIRL